MVGDLKAISAKDTCEINGLKGLNDHFELDLETALENNAVLKTQLDRLKAVADTPFIPIQHNSAEKKSLNAIQVGSLQKLKAKSLNMIHEETLQKLKGKSISKEGREGKLTTDLGLEIEKKWITRNRGFR